jgi:hypothetical protein
MALASMIAVNAAVAAENQRRRVLDAFRVHGATAPERALPLADLGLAHGDNAFAEFLKVGVIRGVDPRGRPAILGYEDSRIAGYYLDEPTYIAHRDGKKSKDAKLALIILGITLGCLLIAALIAVLVPLLLEGR